MSKQHPNNGKKWLLRDSVAVLDWIVEGKDYLEIVEKSGRSPKALVSRILKDIYPIVVEEQSYIVQFIIKIPLTVIDWKEMEKWKELKCKGWYQSPFIIEYEKVKNGSGNT